MNLMDELENRNELNEFAESVNFLLYLKDPHKLINTNETLNCLNKINEMSLNRASTFDHLTYDNKRKFIQILIDYFNYAYDYIKDQSASNSSSSLLVINDHDTTVNSKRMSILNKMAFIVWTWTDRSDDFCFKLHEYRFLRIISKYLNDHSLIALIVDNELRRPKSCSKLIYTFRSMMGCLHNMSRFERHFRLDWKEINPLYCLPSLLESFSKLPAIYPDLRLLVYFTLFDLNYSPQTLTDKLGAELMPVIQDVVELVRLGSSRMCLNESVERRLYKLDENSDELSAIMVVSTRDVVWRITVLIEFLIKLLDLNDNYKHELYEHNSVKVYASRILLNGNQVEKEFTLRLVWKFCTDKRVAELVRHDLTLYSFILGLSMNQHNKSKLLIKYSNCILFVLNNTVEPHTQSQQHTQCFLNDVRHLPLATSVSSINGTDESYNSARLFVYDDTEYLRI